MAALPRSYRVRRPTFADVDAVARLVNAADTAAYGEADTTAGDLISEWNLGRFDLQRDAWLVEAPDVELAGYASLWDERDHLELAADLYVHPAHDERVLGTYLLDLIEERGAEHVSLAPAGEPVLLGVWCEAGDTAKHELFAAFGYRKVREFYRMVIDLANVGETPPWPPGIDVRPFRRHHDEQAVKGADDEAFAEHFRPSVMTLEAWERHLFSHPELDLSLWLVAWAGEEVAGTVYGVVKPQYNLGYVDTLSVRKPWRKRGLGLALLIRMFAMLRDRGLSQAVLGVDAANTTGATRLYERAGMRVCRRFDFFEKDLRSPSD